MNNYWMWTALFLSGENRSALEIVIDSPNLRKFFHFIIGFDSPKLRLHYRTLNRESVQIRFDLKLKLNIRYESWIVSYLCVCLRVGRSWCSWVCVCVCVFECIKSLFLWFHQEYKGNTELSDKQFKMHIADSVTFSWPWMHSESGYVFHRHELRANHGWTRFERKKRESRITLSSLLSDSMDFRF